MAKNASPVLSVRLSIEMPGTEAGNGPTRAAPIAAAIASTVHSGVMRALRCSSCPALSRPSTSFFFSNKDVDGRDKPGHDVGRVGVKESWFHYRALPRQRGGDRLVVA